MSSCTSLNQAFNLADLQSDAGHQDVADALNFSAGTAQDYLKKLQKLAWACTAKSSAKRAEALETFLMEMDAAGESLAAFPSRAPRNT